MRGSKANRKMFVEAFLGSRGEKVWLRGFDGERQHPEPVCQGLGVPTAPQLCGHLHRSVPCPFLCAEQPGRLV